MKLPFTIRFAFSSRKKNGARRVCGFNAAGSPIEACGGAEAVVGVSAEGDFGPVPAAGEGGRSPGGTG